MSSSNLLKSFSIVAISALVSYSAISYIQKVNSPNRFLASVTSSKMASAQFAKSLFDIKVTNIEIGLSEADPSTVQVDIEAFKAIPAGLPYNWNIPDDVTILEGQQAGQLAEFSANQIQTITLKIKGYNKTKKSYLGFYIDGTIGNIKLQRNALLSSRPEDSFEYVVQQNEKIKEANVKASNKLSKQQYSAPVDKKKVVF